MARCSKSWLVGALIAIGACKPDAIPDTVAAAEDSHESPVAVRDAVGAGTATTERAIILIYHHVADDTPPSTSVSVDVFKQHLAILERAEYTVVPLADIVAWLGDGEIDDGEIGGKEIEDGEMGGSKLAAGAVAITFDDAWRSILHHAVPLLQERGWPFTVFVNTDAVDAGYSQTMTWDELRDLTKRGGTIANHSASHAHLLQLADQAGMEGVQADILKARERIAQEIGEVGRGDWLAWPYGEFDRQLTDWAGGMGFVGFGQQSGPVGRSSPRTLLPRFPATGNQATESAFTLRLNTHPLPINEIPHHWRLRHEDPVPELRLSLHDAGIARELSCYNAHGQPLDIRREAGTVTVRSPSPLAVGRNKYTCTAPNRSEAGTWYWYSHPWFRPTATGIFPD